MEWEQQRCKYEVLGLRNDCTAEEVRSAFKELVLQRHPDKLAKPYQCGRRISYLEAAAMFQELLSAYDILSHPKDRARYDSFRRSRILSDGDNKNSSAWNVPDLSLYLSTSAFDCSSSDRGFYKVYSDLFDKIYANELKFATKLGLLGLKEAAAAPPRMGNLDSSNNKVAAFYRYWSRFSTVIDYGWVNQYDCKVNWNYAKYEYSMTVRKLVRFVLKMDKRVIYFNVRKIPLETRRAIVASANLGKKRTKLIWSVTDEEEEEYLEYWRYLTWTIIDQRQHEESRGGGGGGGLDERNNNNNNNNNRRLMLRFDEEERPQELLLCRLKLMRIPYVSSIIYILLLITSIIYCCFFKF